MKNEGCKGDDAGFEFEGGNNCTLSGLLRLGGGGIIDTLGADVWCIDFDLTIRGVVAGDEEEDEDAGEMGDSGMPMPTPRLSFVIILRSGWSGGGGGRSVVGREGECDGERVPGVDLTGLVNVRRPISVPNVG